MMMTSKEREMRHLENQIRTFEDRLLRASNVYEIENIRQDLHSMRMKMQRMQYQRN